MGVLPRAFWLRREPLLSLAVSSFVMRARGILCLCAVLGVMAPPIAAAGPEFERLSLREGLSQSIIEGALQDKKGFLWFATEDGLNRYDGYHFKVLRNEAGNANSLSYNDLKCLHEDRAGNLWIGTFEGGLNRFDPSTAQFTRYRHDARDPASIASNTVRAIAEDRDGTLWVGTQGRGLDQFDPRTGTFRHFPPDPANPSSLANGDVRALLLGSSGVLWVGTYGGGLHRFDPRTRSFTKVKIQPGSQGLTQGLVTTLLEDSKGVLWAGTYDGGITALDPGTGAFTNYRSDPRDEESLSSNQVKALWEDRQGTLWVGTDGAGLNRFHRETGTFTRYRHDPSNPRSLSSDRVFCLFQDRSRVLWVGTYGGGLNKLDLAKKKFLHVKNEPSNPASLSHDIVWSFWEDTDGSVWIGTDSGGLNQWERQANTFRHFRHDPRNTSSLSHDAVRVVFQDRGGTLWLGTNGGGLNRLDKTAGTFVRYLHDESNPASLAHNELRAVYEDRAGDLWVGTLGGGLDRLDRATGGFVHHRHDPGNPQTLSSDFVRCILEDSQGNLWVGTQGGGLNRFDPKSGIAERFQADPANTKSLSNNFVFALHEDREGTLWVATYGGGLNKLRRGKKTFDHFSEAEGLASNSVYAILEDERGRLWLSTNNGLSCFDPGRSTFQNYDARDGLQSNEFNGGSFFKTKRGEMFFGGINGFNVFFPNEIVINPEAPPVVITDLQLFNESVPAGQAVRGRTLLDRPVEYTREIELSPEDNMVTFEFAALHFVAPEKNRYAYRLEGFGSGWILARSDRRSATFTGLSPGDYVFRVKGASPDGVWNETGAAIRLKVLPAFWATWWFRLMTVASIGLLGFAAVRRRMRNERVLAVLKTAHAAQMAIMPREDPKVEGLEVSGVCIPAFEVGGDFFDYFPVSGEAPGLGIVVGDVSGKGMSAAMAASMSSGMVSALACGGETLAGVMTRLNASVFKKVDKHMFTAMCIASVTSRPGRMVFVNAGLCEPILKRAGQTSMLASEGPSFPLGSMRNTIYQSRTIGLEAGDTLIFYSDGVPEARTPDGEPWGYEALVRFLLALDTNGLSALGIREALVQEVLRISGNAGSHDDIAVVVVKVVDREVPASTSSPSA